MSNYQRVPEGNIFCVSSGTLLPLPIQETVVEDQHHPAEFRSWARKRKSCACAAPGDACGNGGIQHQKTMGNI